jgi:hypothetical protein
LWIRMQQLLRIMRLRVMKLWISCWIRLVEFVSICFSFIEFRV